MKKPKRRRTSKAPKSAVRPNAKALAPDFDLFISWITDTSAEGDAFRKSLDPQDREQTRIALRGIGMSGSDAQVAAVNGLPWYKLKDVAIAFEGDYQALIN